MRRLALIVAILTLCGVPAAALGAFARDGRYTGRTTQTYGGKRGFVAFSVGHRGNRMSRIEVNLLYRCPKFDRYPTKLRIRGTFIGRRKGTFAQSGNLRTRGPFGRRARVDVRFYGRFLGHGYVYGEVQAVMAVLRGDKVVDRCAAALAFRARRR